MRLMLPPLVPVCISHSLAVPSREALRIILPALEMVMIAVVCPSKVRSRRPEAPDRTS